MGTTSRISQHALASEQTLTLLWRLVTAHFRTSVTHGGSPGSSIRSERKANVEIFALECALS